MLSVPTYSLSLSTFAELVYRYEFLKLNGVLRQSFAENAPLFYGLALVWLALSYFLGGLNFAIIFSKTIYRDDIRNHGSGNAGFTNMKRTFGTKAAVWVILGDIMKTVISVGVGMILFGADIATLAGLACIFGHCFPCLYKFKGGKGVAATAAMVLILDPVVFVILFIIFALIVISTKYLSMGSMMAVILYPLIHSRIYDFIHGRILPQYFIKHGLYTEVVQMNGAVTSVDNIYNTLVHTATPVMVIVAVFLAAFVVFMHRSNIKRIMNGEESRFYVSKKQKARAEGASGQDKQSRHRLDSIDDELNSK